MGVFGIEWDVFEIVLFIFYEFWGDLRKIIDIFVIVFIYVDKLNGNKL